MKSKKITGLTPLAVLCAMVLPLAAHAAPNVTSVSGTIAHGQVITVSGSGFGTKSPVAPLLYDAITGLYPSVVNGATVPTGTDYPWAGNGNGAPPTFKTSNARGKNSMHYTNAGSLSANGAACLGGNTWSSVGTSPFYVSWWVWAGSSGALADAAQSNKWTRFTSNGQWDSATSDVQWSPVLNTIFNPQTGQQAVDYSGIQPSRNTWTRFESVITNSGVSSSKLGIQMSLNNSVVDQRTSTISGGIGAVNGIYIIGSDFTANAGSGLNAPVDFGEIYVDKTLARVEICNANTKAASNHCEIQIPQTSWNDGQLQVKINQGSFADNSTAYLYVLDASGTANSTGKGVVFGSGGTSSAPSAPANLTASVSAAP